MLLKESQRLSPQIGTGEDAEPVHLVGSDRPHAMELADWQRRDERSAHRRRHDELAVGLARSEASLARNLL